MDKEDMIDLGMTYPSDPAPKKGDAKKVHIDYPTLYIRGKELPDLPEGEFYFMALGKKVGYRDPVDDGAEKSCEIAVLAFKPTAHDNPDDNPGDIEDALMRKVKKKY